MQVSAERTYDSAKCLPESEKVANLAYPKIEPGQTSNNHVRVLIGLFIVMTTMIELLVSRNKLLGEPDMWWHLKTAEWIWRHGAFPTTDPFSFTYAGHPWIAKEWLSQLIYFGAFQLGGWNFVSAAGLTSVAASVAILYWYASRWIKPSIAASIVLACLLLTSSTITIRPHLFSMPILIIWTFELFDASMRGRSPSYFLLILLVAWANLHAAFTMGFVIAFFAFLEFLETTRFKDRRALRNWLIFLALCPLVALLHPYSYEAMMATLRIVKLSDITKIISEWQPFNAREDIIYAVALLAMVFAAMTSEFKLGKARALLIVCLTYLFLAHARYAFFLFPVLTILVIPPLASTYPAISAARWRAEPLASIEGRLSAWFKPIATALAAITVGAIGLQLFTLPTAPLPAVAVAQAIDFLKSHRDGGNVMNYYNFGGPLIFNDIPTFIDGRAEQLYPSSFAKDAVEDPASAEDLERILKKYNIQWTMLPPNDPRTKMLDKLPGWTRAFTDKYTVIHKRTASPQSS